MLVPAPCASFNAPTVDPEKDFPVRARITALLIVVGLLAQAIAIVRHSTTMLGHALQGNSGTTAAASLAGLMQDLAASICHPGSDLNAAALPEGTPARDNSQSSCPICNGLASAYGVCAPAGMLLQVRHIAFVVEFPAFDARASTHRFIRPQSRGPPNLA